MNDGSITTFASLCLLLFIFMLFIYLKSKKENPFGIEWYIYSVCVCYNEIITMYIYILFLEFFRSFQDFFCFFSPVYVVVILMPWDIKNDPMDITFISSDIRLVQSREHFSSTIEKL